MGSARLENWPRAEWPGGVEDSARIADAVSPAPATEFMMSIESSSQPKAPSTSRSRTATPDGPPADWRASIRLSDAAILLAFLALTFLLGMFPLKDTDFWWHLRTGDLIRENGSVPRTDTYLFTTEGKPWIDLHWGFQVAISWVYKQGGVVALNLAKCGVTTFAVFLLITSKRREWPIWAMALAWLPALLVLGGRMYIRPETLTLLYLSIFLAVLFRWHRHPQLAWLLPAVQLAWVNSHGLFVFGPVLLGLALFDAILRRGAFAAGRGAWWRTVLGASLLTGFACLINPYGVVGMIYPFELASTMNNPIFNDSIAELKSIPAFIRDSAGIHNVPLILHLFTIAFGAISFMVPMGWQIVANLRQGAGLGILGLRPDTEVGPIAGRASASGKKARAKPSKKGADSTSSSPGDDSGWKLSPFRLLLFVAFSLLSLKATRNSHQFAAVVGTLTAWNFGEWAGAVRRFRDRTEPQTASGSIGQAGTNWLLPRLSTIAVVSGLFVFVVGGWFYDLCGEKRTVGLGEEKLWFPHEAAEFLGKEGMPERFVAFHVGHASLAEYYNSPQRKGYVDARLEIVGPSLFRSYLELEDDIHPQKTTWENKLDGLGRPSVLIEHELHAIIGATLLASQHWKCVWFDLIGAVFVHDMYAGIVNEHEVDFATRHFRKDPKGEPRSQDELIALSKAARDYLNFLPPHREDLNYPFIWAGLDAVLRLIKTSPDIPEAWKYLGQIELSRIRAGSSVPPAFSMAFDPIRDLAPARATYALRRATRLIPQDFTTLFGLGTSFSERRMFGEAKEALERVVRLQPINKLQAEFISQAKGTIEKIREEMGDPPPSLEWQNLSELDQIITRLIGSGRVAELADLLERAYPIDRASWDEVDRIATTRLQLGQPARARELWSQAKAPTKPGVRQARIAAAYMAEASIDLARKAYLEAIEAAPNLYEARYGLAVLEQDAGNADEASDHALVAMDLAKKENNNLRYSAARSLAVRLSPFLTRESKTPALRIR